MHLPYAVYHGSQNNQEPTLNCLSSQMNDYVAAYHDAVLLIGQVMRNIARQNQSQIQEMEYVNVNYFRNISFNGRETDKVVLVSAYAALGGVSQLL